MKGNMAKVAAWEKEHFGVCSQPDWLDCDQPMQENLDSDLRRVQHSVSRQSVHADTVDPFSLPYGKLKTWIVFKTCL